MDKRPEGWAPCPHYVRGLKRPAPDICPWCKIDALHKEIARLKGLDIKELEEQVKDLDFQVRHLRGERERLDRYRNMNEVRPSTKPTRLMRLKARVQSLYSGLKARWKRGGIK